MPEHELVGLALELKAPWAVTEIRFNVQTRWLDVTVDFGRGAASPARSRLRS